MIAISAIFDVLCRLNLPLQIAKSAKSIQKITTCGATALSSII